MAQNQNVFANFGYIEQLLMRKGVNLAQKSQKKSALFVALLAWIPLLALSLIGGVAFGHSVKIPFVFDFAPYIRFLIAIPILFTANSIINPRLSFALEQFISRDIISASDRERYTKLTSIFSRLNKSPVDEIVIFIIAYVWAILYIYIGTPLNTSTWYVTIAGGERTITTAGWWYLLVSTPLYQFLIFRWVWRFLVWSYFLFRVSKMDLQLIPTHPDSAGGLGFLGLTMRSFAILILIQSLVLSGTIANDIFYNGTSFFTYEFAIISLIGTVIIIFHTPLFFFIGKLIKAKRTGLIEYGHLSATYNRNFDKKWIRGENPTNEEILGTGDIQSLADLGNSYGFIEKMRVIPIDLQTLIALIIPGVLPMLPLLLTAVPLSDILSTLKSVIL
jgi:hypothetical protein